MLILEVDGNNFNGAKSLSVSKSMERLSGSYTVQFPNVDNIDFPINAGSRTKIKTGTGNIILDGYADILGVNYSHNSHVLTLRGRDLTSDIIDSTVKGNVSYKADTNLVDVITQTINELGLNLPVINEAGEIKNFESTELSTAKVGENMFEFLESKCRLRQVLLSTDGKGSIVLRKGGTYTNIGNVINNLRGGENNNILSASVSYNGTKRYNEYKAVSQGNPLQGGEDSTLEGKQGTAIDEDVRTTRYFEFKPEKLAGNNTAEDRAKYEANMRRTRALTYDITVRGHTYDGVNEWDINTLVHVVDDFCFVNADLLLKDVTFNYDLTSGSTTDLTFVSKDSYLAEASKPDVEKIQEETMPVKKLDFTDYSAIYKSTWGF